MKEQGGDKEEEELAARLKNEPRGVKMAKKFIIRMFDVDNDGTLGGKELAAFFSAFETDGETGAGQKNITIDEFVTQGLQLLALEEDREQVNGCNGCNALEEDRKQVASATCATGVTTCATE